MERNDSRLVRAVRRALRPATLGIPAGTAACASVLIAMGSGAAAAADAPGDALPEVVVTGIRASIA